jgi:sodium-coupled neutral amino acid transporter 11
MDAPVDPDTGASAVHVYTHVLPESADRAFWSACITLTLGILGSSVLPVPFAWSRAGIVPGLALSFIVGLANSYTGTLILKAAGYLGTTTYEGICMAAIGKSSKRIAQLSLIALLFGTLAGDAALLADTGVLTIEDIAGSSAPSWLLGSGRYPMLLLIIFLVVPLSLCRRMRSLERAALAGVFLVLMLAIVVVKSAVGAGFPAIASGELPVWSTSKGGIDNQLPESAAILSFAFYTQPMLLPLLSEMPPGRAGLDATCKAVQVVTVGIAFVFYAVIGIFGASRWGLHTQGDVLVNSWLPSRQAGILDAGMAVYLSISMAPMAITMRYLLDAFASEDGELMSRSRFLWAREVGLTLFGIISATSVALIWPDSAEKLFAATGATAVCLVSYILPVSVHLSLYFSKRRKRRATGSDFEAWLLEDAALMEADPQQMVRRNSSVYPASGVDEGIGLAHGEQEEQHAGSDADVTGQGMGRASRSQYSYPHISHLEKRPWWQKLGIFMWHVAVPVIVGTFGLVASASALLVSLKSCPGE